MKMMKIALVQLNTVLGGLEKNLERHLEYIEQARAAGADLVLFPELSLTGYFLQDLALEVALDPYNSPQFAQLLQAAQGIDVMPGFVQVDERGRYSIATAYLSQGQIVHVHHKTYLPTYTIFDDKRFFTPGNQVRAFDTRFGRMGMLICEDYWHISIPYLLWMDGADLFLCQAASPGHGLSPAAELDSVRLVETMLTTYANLFTSAFAYTNRVGYEDGLNFPGGGLMIDAAGAVSARAGCEEGMTLVELDLDQTARRRFSLPLLRDERPELVLRELERILGERA